MASLSCRISPRTSTVIFFDRSPLATAMVTSAMLRTWAVRLLAIELTLSVRSFQTPVTSRTWAWPPSLPSVPTSRATRVTSEVNTPSCLIIVLTMVAERRNSPLSGRPSTSSAHGLQQVALGDRGDRARHLRGRPQQVVDQGVDRGFHVAPGAVRQAERRAAGSCLPCRRPARRAPAAAAMRWLAATMSLKVSAILPGDAGPGRPAGAPRNRRRASPAGPAAARIRRERRRCPVCRTHVPFQPMRRDGLSLHRRFRRACWPSDNRRDRSNSPQRKTPWNFARLRG